MFGLTEIQAMNIAATCDDVTPEPRQRLAAFPSITKWIFRSFFGPSGKWNAKVLDTYHSRPLITHGEWLAKQEARK